MYKNIFFSIIFSVFINWSISMQILNQVSKNKNVKIISSIIAIVSAFCAAYFMMSVL